jgi:hypothetical protein
MAFDWNTLASFATAILVGVGVWEIRQGSRIAQAQFEDSLDQQYRALSKEIPVDALIGSEVSSEYWDQSRELIYNYLDLCNEQVFLRQKRRVRKDTWIDWREGIRSHLGKPAFQKVWEEVKTASPDSFSFLERLELSAFEDDPARWRGGRL